ncbi:MAG: hypothetical protein EBZ91_06980 [Gammaproteobacteria bacterium]|nr:hypothetical protein [Gammaproteobacteria bacterium]
MFSTHRSPKKTPRCFAWPIHCTSIPEPRPSSANCCSRPAKRTTRVCCAKRSACCVRHAIFAKPGSRRSRCRMVRSIWKSPRVTYGR